MSATALSPNLIRPLHEDERAAYWRDGAAVVPGVICTEWVQALQEAVERLRADPTTPGMDFAEGQGPEFFTLTYAWRRDPVLRAWAVTSPLIDLARQVMPDARSLTFYVDQIFARAAGASKVTPFHQDAPYLPMNTDQVLRIWVPLDRVDVDNGAVQYLRGSHLGPVYRARSFADGNAVAQLYDNADFAPLPDFAASYDEHDWLIGTCAPGDVILHHPRTVHGSIANVAVRPRRAIASFYCGDQTRWEPHAGSGLNNTELMGHEVVPDLTPGGPIDCELYPRVWTAAPATAAGPS